MKEHLEEEEIIGLPLMRKNFTVSVGHAVQVVGWRQSFLKCFLNCVVSGVYLDGMQRGGLHWQCRSKARRFGKTDCASGMPTAESGRGPREPCSHPTPLQCRLRPASLPRLQSKEILIPEKELVADLKVRGTGYG